jgi:signal transduction histidine kinase
MPEKGTVKIRLEFQENQIVIFVDDHGCGMSQSEMNAALEPFLQRWDRPTAAGLGLPFVRSLLEAEHGSLLLHSEVGCGTQVRMSFPGTLGS